MHIHIPKTTLKARIGFVSTRLAGTDGVSLETQKWDAVLAAEGHQRFYFAGELDWPADRSYLVPEAHFKHPDIMALTADLFDDYIRTPETSERVRKLKDHLKHHLHEFRKRFDINLLIVENALSLPMNVPLGLALAEFIVETEIPAIGHHHDFYWERVRYAVNAAADYLRAAFPPVLPSLQHVVINSFARAQLALRTGASSTLIPNVMDFDHPPPPPDTYADDLREALNIPKEAYFILQPTRIVPRKRIEHAIELVRRLEVPAVLVISHASGDEGDAYAHYLLEYASLMGVDVRLAANRISYHRGYDEKGRKIYSLADAYQHADLVTYPSALEGFGNAFLETIYYKRPIVMSAYEIFRVDIQPKGFKVITFSEFVDDDTVRKARHLLHDPELVRVMGEHNYELGRRYYSYRTLEKRLAALMSECCGD